LAAHRSFARAAHLRIGAVLIEDIPRIRRLHADLDRAAQNHPECVFLRHYRAPDPALVRQEVERALADILVVRGIYARDLCRRAGVADERIAALPDDPRGETPDDLRYSREAAGRRARLSGQPLRVRLAGLAAARHGTVEALAAIAERPAIELVIRAGEGLEPSELLSHPRVVWASGAALTALDDVVIAPAWCESYPREVALARAAGVPVIATRRAAGFVEPDHIIEPGDSEALGRALDRVRDALRAGAPAVRSRRAPNDSLEQALARALASDPPVRPAR
jgi:glycosyltransferase involved in cell wall biosynthesis